MENNVFSPMEIDAIGEIMNISLGSSATAVSNMLDHRVDITTPKVAMVQVEELSLGKLEPAIGLVIKYVQGLEGSNIMLLKRNDIKVIVDILMGSETPDEEFELNELTISAVCEVMNQMMGAAATALSDFLDRMVNISPPESFEVDNFEEFKAEHFPVQQGDVVVVRFTLRIENALESEFIYVMSVELARELVSGFGLGGDVAAIEEPVIPAPEQVAAAPVQEQQPVTPPPMDYPPQQPVTPPPQQPAPPQPSPFGADPYNNAPAPAQTPPPGYGTPPPGYGMPPPGYGMPPQGAYPPVGGSPYGGYPQQPAMFGQPPQPKVVGTQPAAMPALDVGQLLGQEQAQNLELIMSVPLEVTVEIGRTRRKVQDILSYTKGSLVVLDKLAGDQVDLFVNGKCIARGDVVVIDDNFGIRITEIVQTSPLEELAEL